MMCWNSGCESWVVKKGMAKHREQCPYGLEICEFCLKDILKIKMKEHLKQECQLVLLKCEQCSKELPRRQYLYHMDYDCPEVATKCINYPQCQAKVLRKNLQIHLTESCAYEPTFCTKDCGLALPRGQL